MRNVVFTKVEEMTMIVAISLGKRILKITDFDLSFAFAF